MTAPARRKDNGPAELKRVVGEAGDVHQFAGGALRIAPSVDGSAHRAKVAKDNVMITCSQSAKTSDKHFTLAHSEYPKLCRTGANFVFIWAIVSALSLRRWSPGFTCRL